MEILARFPYSQIDHTKDNEGHLVLSLVAPAIDWVTQRPKLAVLPCIDLSGSMQGSKLEYAKKSIRKLVDQLTPGDICGLFAFESNFHPLVQPEPVTPAFKEKLKAAIDNLRIMGGTNYSGALLGAIEAVKKLDLPLSFVQRIIFFTDGQPTEGVTDKATILNLASKALGTSAVTISFFGYGNIGGGVYNGCDQDFLVECSKQAKGNYAYVKDPDAALSAFGKELGGLLSAYASDIRVSIEPVNGHQITKVVSDVDAEEEDVTGQVFIKIPDLLAEETRHLVMSTKLVKQNQAFPRPATIFNVSVSYSVITADGTKESKQEEIKARVQFVKPDEVQKEADKEIDSIVGLAQMVRAQIEAETKAKAGDYKTAAAVMDAMSIQLQNRGHDRLRAVSQNLSARVGSHAAYSASSGYLRSFQSAGTRAYGVSSMDDEAARDLASTGTVSSNSLMDNMVQAFVEPSVVPHVAPAIVQPLDFGGLTVGGPINLGGGDPLAASGSALPLGGASWVAGSGDPEVAKWGSEEAKPEDDSSLKHRIHQAKSNRTW
jgi:Ca-activated chloride channel family protein